MTCLSLQVPDELARLDLLAGSKGDASSVTSEEVATVGPGVIAPSAKVQFDYDSTLTEGTISVHLSCH